MSPVLLEQVATFAPRVALRRVNGSWEPLHTTPENGGVVPRSLIEDADQWPGGGRSERAYLARGRVYEISDDHPFAAELRRDGYGAWFGITERRVSHVERPAAPTADEARRTEIDELREVIAALTDRLTSLEAKGREAPTTG